MRYLKPSNVSAVLPRVRLLLVIAATVMMLRTMDAQTVNWVEVESGTPSARTSMGMGLRLCDQINRALWRCQLWHDVWRHLELARGMVAAIPRHFAVRTLGRRNGV
jgi:hypothetical protein